MNAVDTSPTLSACATPAQPSASSSVAIDFMVFLSVNRILASRQAPPA
jgi:hypothetical protein